MRNYIMIIELMFILDNECYYSIDSHHVPSKGDFIRMDGKMYEVEYIVWDSDNTTRVELHLDKVYK